MANVELTTNKYACDTYLSTNTPTNYKNLSTSNDRTSTCSIPIRTIQPSICQSQHFSKTENHPQSSANMMIKLLLVCTIAAMAAIVTEADPTGTHVSNCKSMLPGHPGTHPLAGIAAPYDIFVIGDAHLPATGPRTLHVVLSARTKKYPIHGFMLQARVSPSDGKEEAIGEFLLKPNDLVAHTVDCPPGVRVSVGGEL